jgi:polyvinyl alcohol dehydrogenase (cytochrome)
MKISYSFMRLLFFVLLTTNIISANAQLPDSITTMGKMAFIQSCQPCHRDTMNSRIPAPAILSSMTARAVLAAMENGKMRQQASGLSALSRKAIAEWITNTQIKAVAIPKTAFTSFHYSASTNSQNDYSGWGGDLHSTGFRSAAQAGINRKNLSSLKLKWTFAFPDATIIRSKPAVIGNWLLVGSQFGDVFAVNKQTGKIGWHFSANAAIRGAIVTIKKGKQLIAFFADFSTNVYAIDVKTAKLIWKTRAGFEQQSSVTGSVSVASGIVYVPVSSAEVASAVDGNYNCCTSSGGVVALSASTGNEIWEHRVIDQPAVVSGTKKNGKPFYGPSGAPVWCSPTIDEKRGLVYIGTGENYTIPATTTSDAVQALDMKTGKLKWNYQATSGDTYNASCPFFLNCPDKAGPDFDFGMAPILTKDKDGKDILLIGQKSGIVYSLSPGNGKLLWQTRIGKGGALGGVHWGMATDGKLVYAANADNPLALDKSIPDQKASPGIYALDINNGNLIWKTANPACNGKNDCLPCNSAAPAVIPGIVFAGSLDGYIRAYDSEDGKIIWNFNTATTFETTDGIKGKGGSLDGPAPVISDGMLFVNSGYGMLGGSRGNILLAFEVEKNKTKNKTH